MARSPRKGLTEETGSLSGQENFSGEERFDWEQMKDHAVKGEERAGF